ncbi:MAG: amidohydrolase family protein [Desulfobulbus sp.]
MRPTQIIDSHIHCGIQLSRLPIDEINPLLREEGITGACMFAPVEDIYDRYDREFTDTPQWQQTRHRANQYLLDLAEEGEPIFPYLFVWNDFTVEALQQPYRGIKWHRHSDEPRYHYQDPRCKMMIEEITRRRLPIVLEESFHHTRNFIEHMAPEAVIIIPHLGGLNGGYRALDEAGIWKRDNVYADTALASTSELHHFIEHYGADKLLFGSDYPFGDPGCELRKIDRLPLNRDDFEKVVAGNILNLLRDGGAPV